MSDKEPAPKGSRRKRSGMGRNLTAKQAKLVKARVMDPDATLDKLGRKVGYTGAASTWRALQKPEVKAAVISERERLKEMMDARADLGREKILDHLAAGLEAEKQITTAGDVGPDHGTRHRFLTTALELRGALGSEAAGPMSGPINIGIIMDGGGTDEERRAICDVLRAARISRGLHPLENRDLREDEREEFSK